MLKIYLARHGQDEDNAHNLLNGQRDKPLTEKGLEQAETLATKIQEAGIDFNLIFSSPLQRAKTTAEIISKHINGPPVKVERLLIERDFGAMTGRPISAIQDEPEDNLIRTEIITYFLDAENSETFPGALKRAKKLLDRLTQKYKDRSVLLVTHGDIGKMLYAAYYGLDWKDVLMLFHFGNSELLLLSKDSDPGEAHVFQFAQYNH